MREELKPCPFCGDDGEALQKVGGWYYVTCKTCNSEGPWVGVATRSEAVEAWNRRAEPAPDEGFDLAAFVARQRPMTAIERQAAHDALWGDSRPAPEPGNGGVWLSDEEAATALEWYSVTRVHARDRAKDEPVAAKLRTSGMQEGQDGSPQGDDQP